MSPRIAAAVRAIAHACRERDAMTAATTTITTGTTTTTGGAGCDGETV